MLQWKIWSRRLDHIELDITGSQCLYSPVDFRMTACVSSRTSNVCWNLDVCSWQSVGWKSCPLESSCTHHLVKYKQRPGSWWSICQWMFGTCSVSPEYFFFFFLHTKKKFYFLAKIKYTAMPPESRGTLTWILCYHEFMQQCLPAPLGPRQGWWRAASIHPMHFICFHFLYASYTTRPPWRTHTLAIVNKFTGSIAIPWKGLGREVLLVFPSVPLGVLVYF
jgi:hypothetical protein